MSRRKDRPGASRLQKQRVQRAVRRELAREERERIQRMTLAEQLELVRLECPLHNDPVHRVPFRLLSEYVDRGQVDMIGDCFFLHF